MSNSINNQTNISTPLETDNAEEINKLQKEFRKYRGRAKCYSCCILILFSLGLIIGISSALFTLLEIDTLEHEKHHNNDNSILIDRSEKFLEIKELPYNSLLLDKIEKFPVKSHKTFIIEQLKKPHRLLRSCHHHYNKHFDEFMNSEEIKSLSLVLVILLVILWFLNGLCGYKASQHIRSQAARKFKIINIILLSYEFIKFLAGTAFLGAHFIRTRYSHNQLKFHDDDIIAIIIYFLFTILFLSIWKYFLYVPINQHKTLLKLNRRCKIKKINQLRQSISNKTTEKIRPFNNDVIYQPNKASQMYTFYPINQSQQPVKYANQDIINMSNYPHQITDTHKCNSEQINDTNNPTKKIMYKQIPINNNQSQQQAPYFNRGYQPIVGLRENDIFSTNTNKRTINTNNNYMNNYPSINSLGEQKDTSNSFIYDSQVNVPEELESEEKIQDNSSPNFQILNDFQKAEEEKNGFQRTKFNNSLRNNNAVYRYRPYTTTAFTNNMNSLYPDVNDMQRRKF